MRRLAAPALLMTALAATLVADVSGTAGATSTPATSASESCSLPDCFAAIAFNPKTGAWGATKNYPTRELAKIEARKVCKSFDHRDRHCEVLGTVRGDNCLGAAMKVKDSSIVAHTAARATTHRASWRDAAENLSGKQRHLHKVTAVCNG